MALYRTGTARKEKAAKIEADKNGCRQQRCTARAQLKSCSESESRQKQLVRRRCTARAQQKRRRAAKKKAKADTNSCCSEGTARAQLKLQRRRRQPKTVAAERNLAGKLPVIKVGVGCVCVHAQKNFENSLAYFANENVAQVTLQKMHALFSSCCSGVVPHVHSCEISTVIT